MSQRLPISVLTGFLGSGKTTILNRLLRDPGAAKTLVIVNEFGEIGLDHDLIESSNEDTILLQSGCVCCTVRNDLVETLQRVAAERDRGSLPAFDRVVVETTGLAEPAPILQALMTDATVAGRFGLDGIIATLDLATGHGSLDRHAEAVKQIAMADRIVLTKTDLASAAEVGAIRARAAAINQGAPVFTAENGEIDPGLLFDIGRVETPIDGGDVGRWLHGDANGHARHEHGANGHGNRHDDRVRAVSFIHEQSIPGETLDRWLQSLFLLRGPNLLRFKAIVNVAELDTPLVAQGVQHVIHPPVVLKRWPSEDRRTRMVFITYDLDGEAILAPLRDALAEAAAPAH